MTLFDFSYAFPSTIEEIDGFSGKEFEVFLFNFFKEMEFEPRLTDDTNDKGIDLTIHLKPEQGSKRIGIQAKRWKSPVGSEEIRTMLDGKKHYNLDEVWIITTSKLTSSAITTAMNNSIEILTRDHVIQLLQELKKRPNIKFRTSKEIKKEPKPIKIEEAPKPIPQETETALDENNELVVMLKKLRIAIAKEQKITALYFVYGNSTIDEIVKILPRNLDQLRQIKGLGEKKIESFGQRIVDTVNSYQETQIPAEKIAAMKALRTRIAKFNNIEKDTDAFSDEVLLELIKFSPKSVDDLYKIMDFKPDNIQKFGDYLLRKVKELT